MTSQFPGALRMTAVIACWYPGRCTLPSYRQIRTRRRPGMDRVAMTRLPERVRDVADQFVVADRVWFSYVHLPARQSASGTGDCLGRAGDGVVGGEDRRIVPLALVIVVKASSCAGSVRMPMTSVACTSPGQARIASRGRSRQISAAPSASAGSGERTRRW